MKLVLLSLTLNLLLSLNFATAAEITIDHEPTRETIQVDSVQFGYDFLPWDQWKKRAVAPHLVSSNFKQKEDLKVFESRAIFVVNKPATFFSAENLHSLDIMQNIDVDSEHKVEETDGTAPSGKFVVISKVPFPTSWAGMLFIAKQLGVASDKNMPFLEMTSTFYFIGNETLDILREKDQLEKTLGPLDIFDGTLVAINFQAISDFNQIGQFGTMATLFYEYSAEQTLVVVHSVIAVEADVMNMGFRGYKVEDVFLGKYGRPVNSATGIGAGLPQYMQEQIILTAETLESID